MATTSAFTTPLSVVEIKTKVKAGVLDFNPVDVPIYAYVSSVYLGKRQTHNLVVRASATVSASWNVITGRSPFTYTIVASMASVSAAASQATLVFGRGGGGSNFLVISATVSDAQQNVFRASVRVLILAGQTPTSVDGKVIHETQGGKRLFPM